MYSGDGKFTGSTSGSAGQSIGMATLTITANSVGKAFGTLASLSGTAFTQTGLVTANGDSITGVTETCTGCAAAAAVGSYSIVASGATGTGLGNYNISYMNGSLAVSQATSLALAAGKLAVTSGDDLADGCSITVGSFTWSPVVSAADGATAPAAKISRSTDDEPPVVVPDPNAGGSGNKATPPIIAQPMPSRSAQSVALPEDWANVLASAFGPSQQASVIAAFDAVLAEYGRTV